MCDVLSICRKSGASSVFARTRGHWCCATHPGWPRSRGIRRRCCSGGNPCSATRRWCWRFGVMRKMPETTHWRSPALSPPGRRCASLFPRTPRVAAASVASASARNAWTSRSVTAYFHMVCLDNLLHASHFACLEPDLDAARVEGGCCQDVFHDAIGEPSAALILLLRDVHPQPWPDVFAVLPVHAFASFTFSRWRRCGLLLPARLPRRPCGDVFRC